MEATSQLRGHPVEQGCPILRPECQVKVHGYARDHVLSGFVEQIACQLQQLEGLAGTRFSHQKETVTHLVSDLREGDSRREVRARSRCRAAVDRVIRGGYDAGQFLEGGRYRRSGLGCLRAVFAQPCLAHHIREHAPHSETDGMRVVASAQGEEGHRAGGVDVVLVDVLLVDSDVSSGYVPAPQVDGAREGGDTFDPWLPGRWGVVPALLGVRPCRLLFHVPFRPLESATAVSVRRYSARSYRASWDRPRLASPVSSCPMVRSRPAT